MEEVGRRMPKRAVGWPIDLAALSAQIAGARGGVPAVPRRRPRSRATPMASALEPAGSALSRAGLPEHLFVALAIRRGEAPRHSPGRRRSMCSAGFRPSIRRRLARRHRSGRCSARSWRSRNGPPSAPASGSGLAALHVDAGDALGVGPKVELAASIRRACIGALGLGLVMEGHLAHRRLASGSPSDHARQLAAFRAVVAACFRPFPPRSPIQPASIFRPPIASIMVRPGIALYGGRFGGDASAARLTVVRVEASNT